MHRPSDEDEEEEDDDDDDDDDDVMKCWFLAHSLHFIIIINRSLSVTLLFLWVSAKLFCFVLSEALIKLAQIFLHRP